MFADSSVFFVFSGAITVTALVAISIFQFIKKPAPGSGTPGNGDMVLGCLFVFLTIATLIGYTGFLFYHNISRTETEFREHGVYTVATITGGSSYTSRRFDGSEITVSYENKQGITRTADVRVTASQFNMYYEDQEIPILYSERYQGMVKVLDVKLPEK